MGEHVVVTWAQRRGTAKAVVSNDERCTACGHLAVLHPGRVPSLLACAACICQADYDLRATEDMCQKSFEA
jgi:hypothetical protein